MTALTLEEKLQFLEQHHVFGELAKERLEFYAAKLNPIECKLGETIISKQKPPKAFYITYQGGVRVVEEHSGRKPITLGRLKVGDCFGEGALLEERHHQHYVRSTGNTTLLQLEKDDFLALVAEAPAVRDYFFERIARHQKFNFLKTLKLFSHLPAKEIHELLEKVEVIFTTPGEFIFHEQEASSKVFLLRSGKLHTIKESLSHDRLLSIVPGELIGENALSGQDHYNHTVVCHEDSELWAFDTTVMKDLFQSHAAFREEVEGYISRRILQEKALLAASGTEKKKRVSSHKSELIWKSNTKGPRGWFQQFPIAQIEMPVLSGVACLGMITRFYKQNTDLDALVEQQLLHGQPDTMNTMSDKLEQRGFLTRLMKVKLRELPLLRYPAIAELKGGMLMVIYRIGHKSVYFVDPLTGAEQLNAEVFEKIWTGRILTVEMTNKMGKTPDLSMLLKRIVGVSRAYWGLMAWVVAVSLLLQLLGLVSPFFTESIIDKVLPSGDQSFLLLMLLCMMCVACFSLLSSALREFLVAHTVRRLGLTILVRFFTHTLSLQPKLFSQWTVGDFIARFQESEKFLRMIASSGYQGVVDSVSIIIYAGVLFSMNSELATIVFGFALVYGVMIVFSSPVLRDNDRKVFNYYRQVESTLIESITHIESIKAMAVEKTYYKDGKALFKRWKGAELRGAVLGLNLSIVSQFLQHSSGLIVMGYGCLLTLEGELTTGELIAFSAIMGMFLGPLNGLIEVWDDVQEIRISFERINDILSLDIEKDNADTILPRLEGKICFENVSVNYEREDQPVLSGINLTIEPRERVAIVGRSGAGKSTLAKLITRLVEPSEGKITIDDKDINSLNLIALRRQVGVVEQLPFLFHGTIRENISKGRPDATLKQIVNAAKLAGAHSFIEPLPAQYDTQIGEQGLSFSGGQRQRITIARALLMNPQILILDEATSSLDVETEAMLQHNMNDYLKKRTTVVIAHRLSTIRQADKIIFLDKGRVQEVGTHEELMAKKGGYYELYHAKDHIFS